jgi:hypothetical protein
MISFESRADQILGSSVLDDPINSFRRYALLKEVGRPCKRELLAMVMHIPEGPPFTLAEY